MLSILRRPSGSAIDLRVDAPMTPDPRPQRHRPRLGLALGSGAARGWSHIGILRELDAAGIRPDIVVGTSIGAVVGGFYAAGKLDALEDFALSLTRRRMVGLLDLSLSGGAIFAGGRLRQKIEDALDGLEIGAMPTRFAAVATEIGSGHEIWLRDGPVATALGASYAMPGILEPVRLHNRWLFDGALVNPIPVSVCRALGAEVVIAVSLVSDTMFRGSVVGDRRTDEQAVNMIADKIEEATAGSFWPGGAHARRLLKRYFTRSSNGVPGITSVMLDAFTITQDRIARSRLAGDPPDVLLSTRLEDIGLFDFHKAQVLIGRGRDAARRRIADIQDHLYGLPARPAEH